MSAKFGWCNDGAHDQCPVTIRPFYVEGKKVVLHPDSRACECECHET